MPIICAYFNNLVSSGLGESVFADNSRPVVKAHERHYCDAEMVKFRCRQYSLDERGLGSARLNSVREHSAPGRFFYGVMKNV